MMRRLLARLAAALIADDPYQVPATPDDDDNGDDPPPDSGTNLPSLPLPPDAPAEDVAAWEREMARRRRWLMGARDRAILAGGLYGGGIEALMTTQAALVDALDTAYWRDNAPAHKRISSSTGETREAGRQSDAVHSGPVEPTRPAGHLHPTGQ